MSAAFFAASPLRVDLIGERQTPPPRRFLARMAAVTGGGLMGICLWTAWIEMRGQLDFTTTSSTLGIAYTWYWIPLIAGLALSVTGCVIAFLNPQESDTHDPL
jgi:TRAP-type C4-dicarboxylate transport system permease small subunit